MSDRRETIKIRISRQNYLALRELGLRRQKRQLGPMIDALVTMALQSTAEGRAVLAEVADA